jgi:RimJ/RimL family protein N-acetyltransferase
VRQLTGWLFTELPAVTRVEATTRSDNRPMRRVLGKCGYEREARYRQAWPVPGGEPMDALGYAVLRSDWRPAEPTSPREDGAVTLLDPAGYPFCIGTRL